MARKAGGLYGCCVGIVGTTMNLHYFAVSVLIREALVLLGCYSG